MLALVVFVSGLVSASYASSYKDISDDAYYKDAVEALTLYGIVSGYDGSFNPSGYVTRAEFSKMISLTAGLEDEVFSNAGNKKFDDVSVSFWGNAYINTAAKNSLIVGYPDGHFQPNKKITFAEAITVLLRAMNYTSKDLGDNWPYSYMVKAKSLGLTDGINLGDNSNITRADLCVIINRALQTDLNGSKDKLISKMDISITDEILLIATKAQDAALEADQIKTSAGTYKLAGSNIAAEPLTKVKLVLNKDNEVVNVEKTYVPNKQITTVDSSADGITFFDNGTTSKSLGITDNTPVVSEGNVTNYAAVKGSIENGAAVAIIYDKDGSVGYLLFNEANYTEAVVVRNDIYSAMSSVGVSKENVDSASVIRNGYSSSLGEIQLYDVVYYLSDNSTIYAYSDKLSGVYTKAYPNKAAVSSVEISGNILELETQSAAYKLGEKTGSYKLNSRITALLGKDGKIVDVVDLNSYDAANYGVLLSTGSNMSDDILESGKQNRYIRVLNGEGKTVDYRTQKDYSDKIGLVGKVYFDENGDASFSLLNQDSTVNGEVDKKNGKIGKYWLTSDCVIIERTYAPETATGTARAQVIDIDDINVSKLSEKNVLYAVKSGEFDDVSLLIVENVTQNKYTYGVLTKMTSNIGTAVYTVATQGDVVSYNTDFNKSLSAGAGVAMVINDNKLVEISQLAHIGSSSACEAIDFSRIRSGSGTYELGDDVQIYRKVSNDKYNSISIEDAQKLIGKTVNLYADTMISSGGKIRVIIFTY